MLEQRFNKKIESRIKVLSTFVQFFFLIFIITGCSTSYAPVEDRNGSVSAKQKHKGKIPAYYRIKKGDTLYSIAWKYSLDYKRIASINKIRSPYRIYPGKKIRLISGNSYQTQGYSNKNNKKSTKKTSSSSYKKSYKKNYKKKSSLYSGAAQLHWIWPVKGKIIQFFKPNNGKKGIDISAAQGSLIKAAEGGKVVYSGHGLLGYGNMIIINHNGRFFSAYAHNQVLLVHDGQIIKKGQAIARLGRSGTDRYKLHFEIRKNGTPVNPMAYLPH